MGADVVTAEQMKHSLDDWYRVMLQQKHREGHRNEREIESKISGLDVDRRYLCILLY